MAGKILWLTPRSRLLTTGQLVLAVEAVGHRDRAAHPHRMIRSIFSSLVCYLLSLQGTLEEAVDADLLLHVIDASSPDAAAQHAAVVAILRQLGMTDSQLASRVLARILGERNDIKLHENCPCRRLRGCLHVPHASSVSKHACPPHTQQAARHEQRAQLAIPHD